MDPASPWSTRALPWGWPGAAAVVGRQLTRRYQSRAAHGAVCRIGILWQQRWPRSG